MKKSKIKAFTLIELLVVVAIIGILAAIGVVSYSGFTGSAKVSSSQANHANIVKSLAAELKKCEMGTTSLQLISAAPPSTASAAVACARTNTTASIVNSFVNHFNNSGFKNPYTGGYAASTTVTTDGTTTIEPNAPSNGQIRITTRWTDTSTNTTTTYSAS